MNFHWWSVAFTYLNHETCMLMKELQEHVQKHAVFELKYYYIYFSKFKIHTEVYKSQKIFIYGWNVGWKSKIMVIILKLNISTYKRTGHVITIFLGTLLYLFWNAFPLCRKVCGVGFSVLKMYNNCVNPIGQGEQCTCPSIS